MGKMLKRLYQILSQKGVADTLSWGVIMKWNWSSLCGEKKTHKTQRGHQRQRSRGNIERLSGPKKAWRMLRRMLMGLRSSRQRRGSTAHTQLVTTGGGLWSHEINWAGSGFRESGLHRTLSFRQDIRERRIGKLAQYSHWEGGIRPVVPQETCLLSLKSGSVWFTNL